MIWTPSCVKKLRELSLATKGERRQGRDVFVRFWAVLVVAGHGFMSRGRLPAIGRVYVPSVVAQGCHNDLVKARPACCVFADSVHGSVPAGTIKIDEENNTPDR